VRCNGGNVHSTNDSNRNQYDKQKIIGRRTAFLPKSKTKGMIQMTNEQTELKLVIKTIAATLASVNQFNEKNFTNAMQNLGLVTSIKINEYKQDELHFIDFETLNAAREWYYVLNCHTIESRGNSCFILTL